MSQHTNANAATEQIIRQIINAWAAQNKIVTTFFNKYDDTVYESEVAPGRNRAIYLLGHLIASNDGMLPMFGLGERLFPQLEAIFSGTPDRTFDEIPSIAELKNNWSLLNTTLAAHFATLTVEDWLDRHSRVSEADFALDPLRNKLNVLISRTIHQGYHAGQLALLKQPELVG